MPQRNTRVDSPTVEEVERSFLDLELSQREAKNAVERIEHLLDIYEDIEMTQVGKENNEPYQPRDVFETRPYRPVDDEDFHNSWVTRFELDRDSDGALDGYDVAVKDNICVSGVEMTCGSLAFEGFVPSKHAEVVERLLDEGARIVGKTNMDELAFGPTSETSAFGPTTNPRNPEHVSGGSSSGSAAAVASGEVDLALGSDTGGSVRIPASYCGIIGMKPTYGTVSEKGFVNLAYSMDHIGTLASDVETAALGLEAISDTSKSYSRDLGTDLSSLTVGVAEGFFDEYVSDEVESMVRSAVEEFEGEGAETVSVDVQGLGNSRPAWWGIAPVEFVLTYFTNSSKVWRREPVDETLARASSKVGQASSDELGSNVKEMLVLGAHLIEDHDSYHYARAQNLRSRLTKGFDSALESVDVILGPSTPTTALEVGGFERGVTPPVNWNTHPTNLTGHPSISVPCGEADGLPVGLQIIGGWNEDLKVLNVAHSYEEL